MATTNVKSKMIELEISIKLLEYLKRKATIEDNMYNYVVNKLIRKIELEKNKNYMSD